MSEEEAIFGKRRFAFLQLIIAIINKEEACNAKLGASVKRN